MTKQTIPVFIFEDDHAKLNALRQCIENANTDLSPSQIVLALQDVPNDYSTLEAYVNNALETADSLSIVDLELKYGVYANSASMTLNAQQDAVYAIISELGPSNSPNDFVFAAQVLTRLNGANRHSLIASTAKYQAAGELGPRGFTVCRCPNDEAQTHAMEQFTSALVEKATEIAYSWRKMLGESHSTGWGHDDIDKASPESSVGSRLLCLLRCKAEDIFVSENGEQRLHQNLRWWLKELKGHKDLKVSLGAIWVLFATISRGRQCTISEALKLPKELPLVLPATQDMGRKRTAKQVVDNWLRRLGELIENLLSRDSEENNAPLIKVAIEKTGVSVHLRYPLIEKIKPHIAEWQASCSEFLDPNRRSPVNKDPSHTTIVMPLLRFYMEGIIPFSGRLHFGPGCKTRFEIRPPENKSDPGCVMGFFAADANKVKQKCKRSSS